MRATRIAGEPRVTSPFSEAHGRSRCARQTVDADLAARRRAPDHGRRADLRVDRRYEGRSGTRRRLGRPSAACADEADPPPARRFAPGGLLHYGQGKWYPGEPLPRWAFAVSWRTDGEPIWREPDLIAQRSRKSPAAVDDAEHFAAEVAPPLGICRTQHVQPASRTPPRRMLERRRTCRRTSDPAIPAISTIRWSATDISPRVPPRAGCSNRLRAAGEAAVEGAGRPRPWHSANVWAPAAGGLFLTARRSPRLACGRRLPPNCPARHRAGRPHHPHSTRDPTGRARRGAAGSGSILPA